jgi:hypothetical protein
MGKVEVKRDVGVGLAHPQSEVRIGVKQLN